MDKPLFALKDDLDMLAEKVQQLYIGFTHLDWIVQRIKRLDEELACQGEQMRRMEGQMGLMITEIAKISGLETKTSGLETKISGLETKISRLEINIGKIMTHLKIK